MSITFCCLTIALPLASHTQDKKMKAVAGTDIISAVCFSTVRIEAGYGFKESWSAGADIGINIGMIRNEKTEEDTSHRKHLYGSSGTDTTEESGNVFQDISIYIRYWPLGQFNGPFISTGGICRDRKGTDVEIGTGYSFHIWKGLTATIMYKACIFETIENHRLPVKGIRLGLSYVF